MEWTNNINRNKKIRSLRESGHTIGEIMAATGASKSIISYYFKKTQVKDTDRLNRRLKIARNKIRAGSRKAWMANQEAWSERRQNVAAEAKSEWSILKQDPKFMGFLGLYWGEGNKCHSVGIVNNDPGVIMAALEFFRKLDAEAVFDICVRFNPDQDPGVSKKFWESALKIKVKTKPKDWVGKKNKSRSAYGICRVRYNSWVTAQKITTWIDCWRAELGVPNHM